MKGLKIIVLAKQVPDTRNVGKDAMKANGTVNRAALSAIFNPEEIQDHATFDKPQQYATGMVHVFVNGTQVLKDGEHTGELPGQVVKGPGWKGN